MKSIARRTARLPLALALLLLVLATAFGCVSDTPPDMAETAVSDALMTHPSDMTAPETADPLPYVLLRIENCDRATLTVGDSLQLLTNFAEEHAALLTWTASNDSATVSQSGLVTAREPGKVAIAVSYGDLRDTCMIEVVEKAPETDPPETRDPADTDAPIGPLPAIPEAEGSPEGYAPAQSREEALERAERGELAGFLYVPDQAPNIAPDQPRINGNLVRNNEAYYIDDDTYVVVDVHGREVFHVYRGGGYITLEEVAAYLFAFGDVPPNYNAGKKLSPENSIWEENLRLNHSKFSGNTQKYPYEPVLPRISGCGGDLYYYEIDIGTTGTDCDPGYAIRTYNDGRTITRGAARIVYTRFDANNDSIIDINEKFLFYTYNHYNDFREYLNYYNGWGEMFGNITGGGELSSKYDYNPTPYVPVTLAPLTAGRIARTGTAAYTVTSLGLPARPHVAAIILPAPAFTRRWGMAA